jgi:GDP-L-fucose synthase
VVNLMDVLVTGGAGFVGRWFVEHLLVAGHRVVCVDNLQPGGGGLHPSEWPLFEPLKFQSFDYLEVDCREFFADYLTSKGSAGGGATPQV